jgi:hypothetical protein
MTKQIVSAVVAFALALTIVAPVATSAQSMMTTTTTTSMSSYAFTSNLTIGSRGADVIALQSFLEAKGLITIPAGVAKGYFGALTKNAVSAYQVMKGITPTAGYFGAITRGAVQADMAAMGGTTSTGTSTTCQFDAVTGAPIKKFDTNTGAQICPAIPGSTTTTTTTSGTEGTLDVRLASTPADNSNVRVQTDVPVYGIEFRARIADVNVQTVDLKVAVSNQGAIENPSTLVNTIKVWDGSNVIGTYPVSVGTFTKDQNQVYYYRISGLNFMVPKDATKVLSFSFSTNSIDTDRTVTISGYNSSSVRATSGNNISSFYDISALSRVHTFKKPGTSNLTLSAAGNTLRSMNYRVNGNDTLQGVTLATFNLKSQTGDSTLLTVNASTTASGTAPTTLYLYNGSTLLKSKSVSSVGTLSNVSFDNLDTTAGAMVAQSDTPTTFTIKADFPSNTINGTYASTTITSVVFQTPNGNTANANGNAVTNVNQYVYTAAALYTLVGTPTVAVTSDQNGKTISAVATFNFNVTALGANVTLPVGSDFDIRFATSSANLGIMANSVSATVIPNNTISDGSTATVNVTASIASSSLPAAGLYTAYVNSIRWVASSTTVTQAYGLDDFKTPSAFNNVK